MRPTEVSFLDQSTLSRIQDWVDGCEPITKKRRRSPLSLLESDELHFVPQSDQQGLPRQPRKRLRSSRAPMSTSAQPQRRSQRQQQRNSAKAEKRPTLGHSQLQPPSIPAPNRPADPPSPPSTVHGSEVVPEVPSLPPQSESLPRTSSPTKSARSKASSSGLNVSEALDKHGLRLDDFRKELKKYGLQYKQCVSNISTLATTMPMADASVSKYTSENGLYKDKNEDTFLNNVLELLTKKEFQKRASTYTDVFDSSGPVNSQLKATFEPQAEYIPRRWAEEGIYVGSNLQFKRNFLPSLFEDSLKRELNTKDPSMTDAKPDRLWGFFAQDFKSSYEVQIPPEVGSFLHVVDGFLHPFFIVEGKGNSGSQAASECQLRRGGASLVSAHRKLRDMLGLPDVNAGFDHNTYVYSMAFRPQAADFFIHWREKDISGRELFYMTPVKECSLRNDDGIKEARKVYENIMSWGATARKQDLQALHARIKEYALQ